MKQQAELGSSRGPERRDSHVRCAPKILGGGTRDRVAPIAPGRDELLVSVAHELKTPLSIILLTTARMLEEDAAPDGRRQLESIARSAHRMRRLVADLLDSAALEAGAMPVRPLLAPLRPVITEAIEAQEVSARGAGIEILADVPAELPPVWIDQWRILQVLDNLLSNAVKFSPRGGRVRLRATVAEELVTVSVSDNGPGLAEEELAHVFDRFWRAGRATAAGHGIGLSVCRSIIERSGQQIWARSRLGGGTTISFTLATRPPG
jgi:signal transduction histidine kinase